jgi:hypothetical protein
MADSIHTARWLDQFRDEPLDVEVFPSTPHRRLHPLVRELADGSHAMRLRISPGMRRLALVWGVADLFVANRIRMHLLSRRIRAFRPDLLHAMETQHAGYLSAAAVPRHSALPVVLSVWGSDFRWFGDRPRHATRIAGLLRRTDRLVVECTRDEAFARAHGYVGPRAIRVPASGGVEAVSSPRPPSHRTTVAVKGYSGFVGLGPETVRALGASADVLGTRTIVVFSCGLRTRLTAAWVRRRSGLDLRCVAKHALSHAAMLALLADARVVVSLSRSDGFPGVVREALAHGTFVVHSDTACLEDWVPDQSLIRTVDVGSRASMRHDMRAALQDALTDDELVDRAATVLGGHAAATWGPSAARRSLDGLYDRLIDDGLVRRSVTNP